MARPEATSDGTRSCAPSGPAFAAPFELRVSLAEMDPADELSLVLPADYAQDSIARLLDRVFPEDRSQRREVESILDVRANPDLPDIYAAIVDAVAGWRKGLWGLSISADGDAGPPDGSADVPPDAPANGFDGGMDLAEPVSLHLRRPCRGPADPGAHSYGAASTGAGAETYPHLRLRIDQQYRALDYAVREGFWQSKEELLGWLQEMTALYFIDKFERRLPVVPPRGRCPAPGAAGLEAKGLIAAGETDAFVITEEGRGFIQGLLSETEACIDLYDHFQDADFDDEAEDVCFGRGRGVDLRAQVYQAEGLDPIRIVFLLRLYDGSLDHFADRWPGLIEDESFFDELLEPVVNRHYVDDALIVRVVESGYSYLEERHERARQAAVERRIVRRVRDSSSPAPIY